MHHGIDRHRIAGHAVAQAGRGGVERLPIPIGERGTGHPGCDPRGFKFLRVAVSSLNGLSFCARLRVGGLVLGGLNEWNGCGCRNAGGGCPPKKLATS